MAGLEAVTQMCSIKKSVFRNLTKFTGRHLCQSIFFNKVAGLRPYQLQTLLKHWPRCFPGNFVKFLRTPFPTEYLRWLFLRALLILSAVSSNHQIVVYPKSVLLWSENSNFDVKLLKGATTHFHEESPFSNIYILNM